MSQKKTLKQLLKEKQKLVNKTNEIGAELDKLIEERWGFHYSETDNDIMIDALDYGTSAISYEGFVERMDKYKKNFDETGRFGSVI